jgi:hypothetical protein
MESAEHGRVLCFQLADPLTTDELFQHNDDMRLLLDASRQRIHSYVNVIRLRQLPHGVIRRARIPLITHPKAGFMVVVGANLLIQTMLMIATQTAYFDRLRFFDTDAEAWAFLHTQIENEQMVVVS